MLPPVGKLTIYQPSPWLFYLFSSQSLSLRIPATVNEFDSYSLTKLSFTYTGPAAGIFSYFKYKSVVTLSVPSQMALKTVSSAPRPLRVNMVNCIRNTCMRMGKGHTSIGHTHVGDCPCPMYSKALWGKTMPLLPSFNELHLHLRRWTISPQLEYT